MTQVSHPFVTAEPIALDDRLKALDDAWQMDEAKHVRFLLEQVRLDTGQRENIRDNALDLVKRVRERSRDAGVMEAFMREYDLSSEEGVILMCLAEALLRIPDNDTAEMLISDKLSDADWESHLGKSSSVFVNAGTWGLMLTGRLVSVKGSEKRSIGTVLSKIANKSGEPVVRTAIRQAMRIMGHQYVMGRTIEEAMERSKKKANRRFRYSFDMLGEAALTAADARRYFDSYADAIDAIGRVTEGDNVFALPSISVKLSALHPRYEHAQHHRVMEELVPRLLELARRARKAGIALTVDAEEADRLTPSFDVFAAVLADPELEGWDGLGLALQAYQKRAWAAIDWLTEQARKTGHRIPIRLVKGAYWDTEIKIAQVEGVEGYPVFTRKANTDLSYIACADKLLSLPECLYPQFATHNAHTIAAIAERYPLPHLRAGGGPQGPAALPGASPARERRQYLFRQSHRRREAAGRKGGRRPDRRSAVALEHLASAHSAAGRHLRAGTTQQSRHQHGPRFGTGRTQAGHGACRPERLERGADRPVRAGR